ncbi:MAG: M1 family metallopeptidase [Terriglobales bacterium]
MCCKRGLLVWMLVSLTATSVAQAIRASSIVNTTIPNTIPDTTSAINSPTPLSQRVVHYEIDARYDPKTHALDATETLTYHNFTGQPLDTFPFHLYLNAFQPTSTWVREGKRQATRGQNFDTWDNKNYGSEEIKSFEVVSQGDLTSQLQFIHPDDNNADDRTVVQIHLPQPIPPDGEVRFKIKFHDQFPEVLERTGWDRDFVLGGQWFPKVGVWWHGAWNCHQFHVMTEFFADFGVYDVKLTLPQYEVVAASGVRVGEVKNSDGTQTVTYHGDDIHDFAWTASPHYRVYEDTFQGSMGPVKLILLMQPAHWSQLQRHLHVLKETMDRYDRWYGPYPYKTLTMVDPDPGSQAFGMEYPTFITSGTSWLLPEGEREAPEFTVEHEFGHQYWYGMVATNEFEEAWLDEGINSYNDVKVMDSIFGPVASWIDLWGASASTHQRQRTFYIAVPDFDPLTRLGWKFVNDASYGAITFGKTASVLLTLEGIIGEDTLRQAVHTYFMRYRFTHPTKEDFLKTLEEVSGKNLSWYFNQAVFGTEVLDYEVQKVSSVPVEWYKENLHEKKGETVYTSDILIHRKENFVFPVEVEIKFDDGEKVREHWDGQDRWVRFEYQKKAKVVSAEIDPDHKIFLDRNNFNNSYIVEPNTAPANKLVNYWTFVTQFFAQFLSWWLV